MTKGQKIKIKGKEEKGSQQFKKRKNTMKRN